MTDPVELPSKKVVDRSTIKKHLLNDSTDPFNRAPMTEKDLIALPDLQKRIEEYKKKKMGTSF